MKHKVQPKNVEIPFPSGNLNHIVSKTDLKGKITYCNELFIEMSRYKEEELLGKPHNIIRHPDMPRVVFKLLWDTIQAGNEVNAYVKNLAKDGSFYWVFANVTPSYDLNNNIVGYFSVRRKPSKEILSDIIEPLYGELLRLEKSGGMQASEAYLNKLLQDKGLTYEEFILTL